MEAGACNHTGNYRCPAAVWSYTSRHCQCGDEKVILPEDDVSEDMKAFLTYIAEGKTGDKFTEELESAVTEARLHKEWLLMNAPGGERL